MEAQLAYDHLLRAAEACGPESCKPPCFAMLVLLQEAAKDLCKACNDEAWVEVLRQTTIEQRAVPFQPVLVTDTVPLHAQRFGNLGESRLKFGSVADIKGGKKGTLDSLMNWAGSATRSLVRLREVSVEHVRRCAASDGGGVAAAIAAAVDTPPATPTAPLARQDGAADTLALELARLDDLIEDQVRSLAAAMRRRVELTPAGLPHECY
ncbi:hypothetical protein B484DRAFT_402488 [Ochromonadaceae sp. CCMP2298]|nr:hypothetical protein B484DRAFT_402488 [Ochromonadaceae sp. CCMP2298]